MFPRVSSSSDTLRRKCLDKMARLCRSEMTTAFLESDLIRSGAHAAIPQTMPLGAQRSTWKDVHAHCTFHTSLSSPHTWSPELSIGLCRQPRPGGALASSASFISTMLWVLSIPLPLNSRTRGVSAGIILSASVAAPCLTSHSLPDFLHTAARGTLCAWH